MDPNKPEFWMLEGKEDFRGGRVESPKLTRSAFLRGRGRARGKIPSKEEVVRPGSSAGTLGLEKIKDLSLKGLGVEEEEREATGLGKRGSQRGAIGQYIFRKDMDLKPSGMKGKEGGAGRPLPLFANYFALLQRPTWTLYQHRVDFDPVQDHDKVRKGIIYHTNKLTNEIGPYIFDGTLLYSPRDLGKEDGQPLVIKTERKTRDGEFIENVEIRIRKTMKLESKDDIMYRTVFNLVLRKCLHEMKLELMGRNYFDRDAAIRVPQHRLELWPGFETSIRKHDNGFMLCAELTHKVLRLDSVLTVINGLKNSRDFRRAVEDEIVDTIVMTTYNRKTYRVSDIDWNLTPNSTFIRKGRTLSLAEYCKETYLVEVRDMTQPLLVIRPTPRELRDPKFPKDPSCKIYLIPETCQMTGLTQGMRANFGLMKDLATHLHTGPVERVDALNKFMKRLLDNNRVELKRWELDFDRNLAKCQGRILPTEGIIFAGPKPPEIPNASADWTMAFRSRQMLTSINLEHWGILVPTKDAGNLDNLLRTMTNVARPLGMSIYPPTEILKVTDLKPPAYALAAENLIKKHRGNFQLLFIILPNNAADRYSAVKKRLSISYGVPTQCFLSKNVTSKGLMSIATKVVIQINAKLGGEPWTVQMPLKKTMIVGYDVNRSLNKPSVGALVASTTQSFASYFSSVAFHTSQEELSKNIAVDLAKAVHVYSLKNGELPDRVIFFRDGVGEGQLNQVADQEISQLTSALNCLSVERGAAEIKLSFIVVTKKINTRLFSAGPRPANPPPGTVLDNVITIPERFDYFLIATSARQGTVSPCSYTVLHDAAGLGADKLQRITFKMCHMYFNWSGTVAVPAPCQYAHKLAFLTGIALGGAPSANLQHLLHFL